MIKGLIFTFFLSLIVTSGIAQTAIPVSTGGTGWKRIAYSPGVGGRGFGKISLYTIGGSASPIVGTIDWYHDWLTNGGLTFSSNSKSSSYWSAVRITDDGTRAYIEVNFTKDLPVLYLISDNYGWNTAKLYTDTLPDGGGTVRSTTNVAKINIDNNFIVGYNGNVGIGTSDPQAKLAVDGNILAKEIKVKTDISVPDYVFDAGYKVRSLAEVERYVQKHKHLPEIPSAKEIGEKGLDLAEMNLLLLKKVEELTLMLIEKEKIQTQQAARLSKQEASMVEMEQKIQHLMKYIP